MNILINMEMPISCCDCPLFKSNVSGQLFCRGKRVAFGKEDAEWLPKTTPNWCPLVHIPPHGRLIDADALWVEINKICDRHDAGIISDLTCVQQLLSAVRHTPTIIPAEEDK